MHDVISRQAAIELAMQYCPDDDGTCSKADENIRNLLDELEDLPSAQPENNWIPVTKKAHPDLPIRVQVQLNNGWIITAFYQDGEWISVPDCEDALQDEWIEAWRELPEPYKRNDNGQT